MYHRCRSRSELPAERPAIVHHFLTALAVCNTSFIVHDHQELMHHIDYQPKYEGDNADDLVLCQTASQFGVRMIARSVQTILVRYIDADNAHKQDQSYELLCLLPFDSTRRRMSIIVRRGDDIFLFIKGAETSIWPHLSALNDPDVKMVTEQHSLAFAEQGFRSLLVAYRQLTVREFEDWFERYRFAANSLDNREEAISDAATAIEENLMLAGLTAVEDKLQEGVPRAIASLRCAGIKIWLLTGDKQATALSTAQAASLVNMAQQTPADGSANGAQVSVGRFLATYSGVGDCRAMPQRVQQRRTGTSELQPKLSSTKSLT
jgi:phospholipid-translocating ATPase